MTTVNGKFIPRIKQIYTREDVIRIRVDTRLTPRVFALCLNTSTNMVKKWEKGVCKPSFGCCKLLSIIERKGIEALL